ncbi:polysaccharide deacetylase family protein [Leucobacter sp. wl10]|uniref:polysaccharide deacetylase family protein n=1 Tax=Leucobacter sp. wl10 TaxID=2304677 RepID=UPI000E5A1EBB|nr:polysaccharide deacetylase family protein [Leucobacter sp. wl10]RGE20362.1 polysaccharide deacetylase [Leucobacter sp. wl10]
MKWPEGKAHAFTLSIDVDGDLPLLAEDPENIHRHKSRSAGLYGPEHGAPRLLGLLTDLGITAQWFFPGEIANRYPGTVRAVHEAGHGIGVHGHRHLDFDRLALEGQVDEMIVGRAAIEQITGEAPRGFRTPGGEWREGFPAAMQRAGFAWSSSLPSDELPFHLTGTELVEIPFRYELEDQQYLGYNLDPPFPPGQSRITPLESVEENWWCEVRGAARYGTLVHLRLNAEVMGIASRARMLRRFLTGLQAQGNAWFATCAELHAYWSTRDPDPSHPYALFTELARREA